MKVKVLKTFRDKETGSILRPNLIIDITEARVEELTSTLEPFVEVVEEVYNVPDFEKMTKAELMEYATGLEVELNMEMTKVEMIELLKK